MNNKTLVILLAILVCLGGLFYFYPKYFIPTQPEQVFCTQEAKLCPDGSYVGRTGLKCEFAECPPVKEGTPAALNQRILVGGIFITPLEVISDSRCPVDVTCIWAGEVNLKVRLEKGTTTKETILKSHAPFTFADSNISLESVTPENNSKSSYPKENYRFIFKVTPINTIFISL